MPGLTRQATHRLDSLAPAPLATTRPLRAFCFRARSR